MEQDLSPDVLMRRLKTGSVSPIYLFYGPDEFQLEFAIARIKEMLIPETMRELNSRSFYCDDDPGKVVFDALDSARSFPFLADRRLILLRRLEKLSAENLELLASYAKNPAESTCLICISARADFRIGFYKTMRSLGAVVSFRELRERELIPWIKERAGELGLRMGEEACEYLCQLVGVRLIDLHSELEKLSLRYGSSAIGVEEIKELALNSRIFSVFELMDAFSMRDRKKAIPVLERYIEEESGSRAWDLKLLGMFNRQVNLLLKSRALMRKGMTAQELASRMGLRPFQAQKLLQQSAKWQIPELIRALKLLYDADGLLKTGGDPPLVMKYILAAL
ncbi:MAG: DNA polymerase III subunit delta [Deltaproteobacteria bacterium CG_4_8_14_3_um_filter_51_11]|nr:DNA polymerase III subunit delta [bacterium]OIP42366.1 MAG: DNA polymerase III subunit delta [Desulfobacteraceae bacterium CG2_30_51_40]PIP47524.1 MAG: DNA polymerase III subunit delta [Deltaproteobacteria bacterium CG23_combo_of_CG06-09_8_20_14_all_51_20]PIW00668.1 MAG: DNA polymerase III subunit delta [Deltaproteobacteria bacterium CG17_big_fil_post_rev_8_21_14_2_50_51_6]PIX20904.1 MAG: DNA polymerase III subunit delta [Deltaproteobacteria bacterium CG_4_8_14_3_um_filter_51_11]PIY23237.1 